MTDSGGGERRGGMWNEAIPNKNYRDKYVLRVAY